MNDLLADLDRAVPLQGPLGYLNFSEGRADARFQKQISAAYDFLSARAAAAPWRLLYDCLRARLETLHHEALGKDQSAFRDIHQAAAVLNLAWQRLLPAYRVFHADLLAHCTDADLFQPGFLVRACEAVLAQRGPWNEETRIVQGALRQLNDYVGHRPVATLQTRPRGEPYEHERFRPIPLAIKGAGALHGRYAELVGQALDILAATDQALLQDACFDPNLLDELALDVRAYDFNHPAEKRPNYCFGEWDPHLIDNQGRYRRYVVRQIVLDALVAQIHGNEPAPRAERVWEAAAVLAGTILMGAGVSGSGPETHDSSVTLAKLVPRIAQYRETFYANLLNSRTGPQAERLRDDAQRTRQPFGGIRQRLNHYMARQRALQLQQRQLALLFAEIGYAEASRRQAAKIPVRSTRMLTEMHWRLTSGQLLLERGDVTAAAKLLPEVEDLLRRGIACGAVVDPWNILGFQAQYPRFTALEDSVRDQRVDDLIEVAGRLFTLYARVVSDGTATGALPEPAQLLKEMQRLAEWWDRFATVEVSDVPKVHGGQALASAEHVARALSKWRERGEAAADLAFWRAQLEDFHTPKAFAIVIEALLRKEDYRAAMALLMTWLGQCEQVPLQHDEHSFHALALRWMLGICSQAEPPFELIAKFFDYLEANAEEYWEVPRPDTALAEARTAAPADEEEDSPYSAAYEGVTYQDSTDDNVEGEVLDVMPQKDFDLDAEAQRLEPRVQFLSTLSRLWNIATRGALGPRNNGRAVAPKTEETLRAWLVRARQNFNGLGETLERIHAHDLPRPSGSYESLVEFNRRRVVKERLVGGILGTCLETALAVGAIQSVLGEAANPLAEQTVGWEPFALRMEQALWRGDADTVCRELPGFIEAFRSEPLLYVRLEHGGHPGQILRASLAQIILRALVVNLPRLGLLRETLELARTAKSMEEGQKLDGPRTTEFDRLFHGALQALVEAVVESARGGHAPQPDEMVRVLETLIEPLLVLWIEHSEGTRISTVETVGSKGDWAALVDFIKRYGADLFQPRFMAAANLNGVLHQGVGRYLDYLRDNADPLHPVKLVGELDDKIPRVEAERWLQFILHTVLENYAEYQDYKATTTQSDYGDNLHQLFEFLRLKVSYERNAWKLRPLYQAHEVLARRLPDAATAWRAQVAEFTSKVAEEHTDELARLEKEYGMRLRTIADRIEERFTKPLEIDRVTALVEPAMNSARAGAESVPLEAELAPLADSPAGVGMEVPYWLRRLGGEVARVRQAQTAVAGLVEELFQVPRIAVAWTDLLEQLKDWRAQDPPTD